MVLGQGIIGLAALQLARLNGGFPVIGVDFLNDRLRLSEKCGADHVLNPNETDLVKKTKELTGGEGANVVLEVTGNPQAIPGSFELAAQYGRVLLLGSPRGEAPVNFYPEIHCKGISVIGAHAFSRPRHESYPRHWTEKDDNALILNLVREKRLDVDEMISLRFDFRDAKEAYGKIMDPPSDVLGVILRWN